MTPIQQLMLGAGGAAKTYLDDVFSTHLYTGQGGTTTTITNGINLSGDGGMVWTKGRSAAKEHFIIDTVRGATSRLKANDSNEENTGSTYIQAFNNNGYSVGSDDNLNGNNVTFASWSFRKAKGFFDVVKYTGNGTTGRTVSHSLGSVPGCIIIKSIDTATSWFTYHRDLGPSAYVMLNHTNAESTSQSWFMNDVTPTSRQFTLGSSTNINGSGTEYIAYLFAGGESTASEAVSVDFDGSTDSLTLASSTDLDMGTGDFTVEFWYKADSDSSSHRQTVIAQNTTWGSGFNQIRTSDITHGVDKIVIFDYDETSSDALYESNGTYPPNGQWRHVAVVRASSVLYVYVDGVLDGSMNYSGSFDLSESNGTVIGYNPTDTGYRGNISNLRVVKGTAVYTSAFRPPTEPLTNITNTKLLCCNNSSTTGSTVTPGTITANGDPTASTDSPFDDPTAFTFGDSKESVIKCGSYVGNGSDSTDIDIHLGWEPTWLLVKQTANSGNWQLVDSATHWPFSGNWETIRPNLNQAADASNETGIQITPTGFKIVKDYGNFNNNNDTHIFVAIRRPDGYVGKPPELGTGVFTTAVRSSSTEPRFISNFPVDFALYRNPASAMDWFATSRLTGSMVVRANTDESDTDNSDYAQFDHSNGFQNQAGSGHQAWMWKRHAGFDVVTWNGDSVSGRQMPHSMGKTPEMMWVKRKSNSEDWTVYHYGQNGGTNPEQYRLRLNTSAINYTGTSYWNNTAPTSTHFTLGNDGTVNANGETYLAMLFASVAGISKCGQYTPASGSTSTTVTCGFSPRLVIVKCVAATGSWHVGDTVRGISSGNDPVMMLNESWANDAYGARDWLEVSSTGFTVKSVSGGTPDANRNGDQYIYYAHA